MKCVIGGAQLRVFGRAIHAIARISDEFWFDPVEKGLALRSVNSSRSAYACVFFSSMFFQQYYKPGYKLMEIIFIVKKLCVNVLERNVEKCSISTSPKDHHVTFQLLCRHGKVTEVTSLENHRAAQHLMPLSTQEQLILSPAGLGMFISISLCRIPK
uniref:RAD9 checkpoint clamp component B n=1 Tax=Malurus cyaneus samueli TaxID=2593467 RepID=A0A8C5UFQ9_9PASS